VRECQSAKESEKRDGNRHGAVGRDSRPGKGFVLTQFRTSVWEIQTDATLHLHKNRRIDCSHRSSEPEGPLKAVHTAPAGGEKKNRKKSNKTGDLLHVGAANGRASSTVRPGLEQEKKNKNGGGGKERLRLRRGGTRRICSCPALPCAAQQRGGKGLGFLKKGLHRNVTLREKSKGGEGSAILVWVKIP